MNCCGPETKYIDRDIIKKLRNIKKLKNNLKLISSKKKYYNLYFDGQTAEWKSKGENNKEESDSESKDENHDGIIQKIKTEINEIEIECENLEKEYLAKTIKLLYMVQTHCQLKNDNEQLFEHYKIKSGNVFLPNLKEKNENDSESGDSEENEKIKRKNKEKKVLVES